MPLQIPEQEGPDASVGLDSCLALLDVCPNPVWLSGADGLCHYFNRAWLDFTGGTHKSEVGEGWTEGVHQDDVARVILEYQCAFAGRGAFKLEYRLRRHDGEFRHIVDYGRPYTNQDGKFSGYVGSCYDVTERVEAENELRESETRFRQLAENINKVFWLCDPDWNRIYYASPTYEKMWGQTAESLYLNPRSWLDRVHSEDRERVSLAASYRGATKPYEETYRLVRPDGAIRWIHAKGFPVCDDDGKYVRIAGIAEDITEMKQADEAIRTLLRISFNLNSTIDAKKLMEFLAVEAIELLGAESGWAGIRQAGGIAVHCYLKNATVIPLDCCWPPGHGLAGWQLEHKKPYVTNDAANDPQINPEIRKRFGIRTAVNVPILDSSGELLGCLQVNNKNDATIFTPSDVAKLVSVAETASVALQNALAFQTIRQKESEVAEANEKLLLLSRRLLKVQEDERRTLAYELHDGVGQTLSAVKIGLQTAQNCNDPATMRQQLDDSVGLVGELLQQVRKMALDLRPSILDHLGLMPALRWYFDQQRQRSGLNLEFRYDDSPAKIPQEIQTACYRIAQEATTNILRHAKAHHVEAELKETDGVLEFTIRDDGVGFNLEKTKLQASLGMVGMNERAIASGGTFEVMSFPAKGTTIRIRLPLKAAK